MAESKKPALGAHIRHSASDRIFLGVNGLLLTIFLVIILYPLLYILSASVSAGSGLVNLWLIPRNFTLTSYEAVWQYADIWTGYANSLFYMVAGTAIAMFVTICCAYPLSVPDFKARNVLMVLCMITMYFGGGLIPTYLVVRDLGMLNTVWSVLLPGAMSVYNVIVMRTFFASQIPRELRESASLDGCGNIRYLVSIVLPLSGAILAVISLYYAVGIWNSYFDAMIYLKKREMYPLTLFIREILIENNANAMNSLMTDVMADTQAEARRNLMKYAVIVVSSLPMMILYPFVQKYFVKGVMIGAVKG